MLTAKTGDDAAGPKDNSTRPPSSSATLTREGPSSWGPRAA